MIQSDFTVSDYLSMVYLLNKESTLTPDSLCTNHIEFSLNEQYSTSLKARIQNKPFYKALKIYLHCVFMEIFSLIERF